jgi:hypothetical protein
LPQTAREKDSGCLEVFFALLLGNLLHDGGDEPSHLLIFGERAHYELGLAGGDRGAWIKADGNVSVIRRRRG